MREAAKVNDWTLNNAGIAAMWRGGCIIKVGDTHCTDLSHLNVHPECFPVRHHRRVPPEPQARESPHQPVLPEGYLPSPAWMEACHRSVHVGQASCDWYPLLILVFPSLWGIPIPAFTTALSFFDGYRTETLPANLIQAQRDYFGGQWNHRQRSPLRLLIIRSAHFPCSSRNGE